MLLPHVCFNYLLNLFFWLYLLTFIAICSFMLQSNFKLILRQLRSKYSLINLAGLTVGFIAFILIFLWVNEEVSYDRFHPEYQTTFRIVGIETKEEGELYPIALTPAPLSDYSKGSLIFWMETIITYFLVYPKKD